MLCSNKCCLSQRFNTTIIRKEGLSDFESNFFYLTLKLYLPSLIKRTVEIIVELTKKTAEIKILPSLSTIFSFLLEQRFLSCYTRAHVLTTRERAGNHGRRVEHLARKRKKKGSLKRERERENSPFTKRRRREGT